MISIWGVATMNLLNKFIIFIGLLGLLSGEIVHGQNNKDVAIILKSKGEVQVRKEKSKNWNNCNQGGRLDSGDILKTSENSLAAIMFTDDKSLLKVRDNSTLAIRGKRTNRSIAKKISCKIGNFWIKATKQNTKMVVETPSGMAAVKGTEFYGIVDAEGNTLIIVIEGMVQLLNKLGEVLVHAGQTGKLTKNGAPVVFDTDPNSFLNWANDDEGSKELLFEFQDSDGNKKHLKIIYH
jgi:uncharacterized protein YxjI